jgi:hypothetical protein
MQNIKKDVIAWFKVVMMEFQIFRFRGSGNIFFLFFFETNERGLPLQRK